MPRRMLVTDFLSLATWRLGVRRSIVHAKAQGRKENLLGKVRVKVDECEEASA